MKMQGQRSCGLAARWQPVYGQGLRAAAASDTPRQSAASRHMLHRCSAVHACGALGRRPGLAAAGSGRRAPAQTPAVWVEVDYLGRCRWYPHYSTAVYTPPSKGRTGCCCCHGTWQQGGCLMQLQ